MVMEVVHEEMGEGNMQCTSHPYKNSTPGGICAFCLQEKLGKLISSPSVAVFPSSSSSASSSPSFRPVAAVGGAVASETRLHASSAAANSHDCSRRSRLPFVLIRKKKRNEGKMGSTATIVFRRSNSTATPGRALHLLDENFAEDYSPRRRGFWSFLYTPNHPNVKRSEKKSKDLSFTSAIPFSVSTTVRSQDKKREETVVVEENGGEITVNRKVSRSRSIGCGSRSFSGDFFERISTGFSDCTLRRVESQREGRSKSKPVNRNSRESRTINGQDCIKERVRCGIFSGFTMTSSSSSSLYWVSEDNNTTDPNNVKPTPHSRRNWKRALASPIRAFTGKRDPNSNKNNAPASPNLAAIPSLLTMEQHH